MPDDDFPVILPRASQGLFLLQRLRDEAHRFAITFHRSKRGKAMLSSALDGIPGLGAARRDALLAQFGTLQAIREADVEQLTRVRGIGPKLAEAVQEHLRAQESAPAPDSPPEPQAEQDSQPQTASAPAADGV